MITKIKQIIFTDKKKDWTLLSNAAWPFKMLHLELEDWKFISKFYKANEAQPNISIWVEYNIEYKQNWIYFNLISLSEIPEWWYKEDESFYDYPELIIID